LSLCLQILVPPAMCLGRDIPERVLVHAGFNEGWRHVAQPVCDTVTRLFASGRYKRLVIAGHSLGGALATLAAVGILDTCFPTADQLAALDLRVVTFGSPRVGNRSFCAYYDRILGLRAVTWREFTGCGSNREAQLWWA
jgi:predicted lipase